jgi:CheY-like chemotaxis protein
MRAPRFSALVVEDDPIIRQYVMRALAKEEFQCNGAADGIEGTAALERGAYDVVVSDLGMPNKNGHALACEILARQARPGFVILTGIAEPRIEEDLRRRGVDAIVHKPVNLQFFAKCVHKLAVHRQEMLDPRSDTEDPAALDFSDLNVETAIPNKFRRSDDFWNTTAVRPKGEMAPVGIHGSGNYEIVSSLDQGSDTTPYFQKAFTESQGKPYQLQTSFDGKGVLDAVPAIRENQHAAAFVHAAPRQSEQIAPCSLPGVGQTRVMINRQDKLPVHILPFWPYGLLMLMGFLLIVWGFSPA